MTGEIFKGANFRNNSGWVRYYREDGSNFFVIRLRGYSKMKFSEVKSILSGTSVDAYQMKLEDGMAPLTAIQEADEEKMFITETNI